MNIGVHAQLTGTGPNEALTWDLRPATRQVFWLNKHLPNPEDQREYARDRCITAFTEALGKAMHNANISRAGLAEKLGKSRGQISRLLNGAHNMTLVSLADVLWACNLEVEDPELAWGELGVIEVSAGKAPEWEALGPLITGRSPPEVEASQASHYAFPVLHDFQFVG